jgi:hypothetical protein
MRHGQATFVARLHFAHLARAHWDICTLRAAISPPSHGFCRSGVARSLRCMHASSQQENTMARGSKASYTGKQKRQASKIEKGYEKRGVSKKTAAARAWATVNKETGGGKKRAAKKTTGRKSAAKKSGARKTAAKKGGARKSAAKKSARKTASRKSASKKSSSRR